MGLLEDSIVKKLLLAVFALVLFTLLILDGRLREVNVAAVFEEEMQTYSLYSDGRGSSPSILWDGAKFTLKRNVEGTIILMNDSIIFDGAGFTLRGDRDSIGIAAYDKTAVTIKNVKVENYQIGILLGHYSPDVFLWYDPNPNRPTNCTISNCNVSNNSKGIIISGGIKCRIIGNQVTNNENGIVFFGTENIFRNNEMENDTISFRDLTYEKSDVDSSNTINGKPIYYLINQQNMNIPKDASLIHLEGCKNISISNLEIKRSYKAISMFNSSNCKIYGNTLTNNEVGIHLRNSANNSIIYNKLLNNTGDAIELYDSENSTVANNLIQSNGCGIDSGGYTLACSRNSIFSFNKIIQNSGSGIQSLTQCIITGNYIAGNGHGIYFWDISNSIISKNTLMQNQNNGLTFRIGSNASINGNNISKNMVGIEMGMEELSECTITENNIVQNTNFAIGITGDAKNCHFYLNNFIDNNNGSVQVSIKGRFVWKGDEGYDENSKVFPQYVASYNKWDNGSMGNFWSDNNSSTNGTIYKIADRNIDNHPLLTPTEFSALELPSTEVPQELSDLTQSQETEPTSFPIMIVAAVALIIVLAVAAGLLFYNKKHKAK